MKKLIFICSVILITSAFTGCQKSEKIKEGENATAEHEAQEQGHEAASKKDVKHGDPISVADAFAKSKELSGQTVTLKGDAVKFSSGIMGMNWVHLQDGTGSKGTNDLTVTTNDFVKAGDKITITGTLTTDKDFGSGYFYAVIIEDASITVD